MGPTTFDAFTKALATPSSRRRALKGLVVAALGGGLGFGGIEKISTLAAGKKVATVVTVTNLNSNGSTNSNSALSDPASATGGNASAQTGPITITEPIPVSGPASPAGPTSPSPAGPTSPCPAGRVQLSNGTCAQPCTAAAQCCVFCVTDISTGASYCTTGNPPSPPPPLCAADRDCPSGSFCVNEAAGVNLCVVAC